MELDEQPATVRALTHILRFQAVLYPLTALTAGIAYLVRGPGTLSLGAYATARTHPLTLLVTGLVAGALLFSLSRRIRARPRGLHRQITVTEAILLADGALGFALGVFNVWWLAALLAAPAALWCLRAEDTDRYLD